MKKLIAFLLVTLITYSLVAQEEVQPTEGAGIRDELRQTLINFSNIHTEAENLAVQYGDDLRLTLSPEEFATLQPINYSLGNWLVKPAPSITYPEVLGKSYARPVEVLQSTTSDKFPAQGDTVLGVRLRYPNYNYEMRFEISAPFPANFNDDAFISNGILQNVGLVKSAYLTIYGLYQHEKVFLITEDSGGNTFEYGFGSLEFVGWRELEWINPAYIDQANERELDVRPLYPKESTNRRFKSIKVVRTNQSDNSDFVTYISNVKLTFDKAINDDLFREFSNEDTWGIIKESASVREKTLITRTTTDRFFQYLEERKKFDYNTTGAEAGGGQ